MLVTNKYMWIGGAIAALGAIYLAKRAAGAVVDTVEKVGEAINPFNPENVFNQGAIDIYQWATGSDSEPGSDIWDYLHKAEPVPGSGGGLINYTPEQQARDMEATRRLESGYHGM